MRQEKKMRLRFLIVSAVIWVAFTGIGHSQTFTGMLDGYWSYNLNTPVFRFNNLRAFDVNDQAFSLNYGELAVDYKPGDVGIRVDLGFGDAAERIHSNPADTDIWRHFQQAYITAGKGKFTADFGKFVTPVGAEVMETKDNWNYTRGVLFSFGKPFYHFGAKGTYVATDKITIGSYVVNGWDNVRDNNTGKTVGVMGVLRPTEKIRINANFLFGQENPVDGYRELYDSTVTYTATDRFSLMANYEYGRDKTLGPGIFWQGAAVYGKVKAHDQLTVASRYEWFGDTHNAFRTGNNQELQSFTATSQIPWSGLTLWGEYRRDWSTVSPFIKTDDDVSVPADNQDTFTVGVTYSITKDPN
jgi:hypothetical protein